MLLQCKLVSGWGLKKQISAFFSYCNIILLGDDDNGSGETSGDEVSGSGDGVARVRINDLWHFNPNTTHAPPSSPASAAAKKSTVLSSFVIDLTIVCVIFMVMMPSAHW